MRRSRTIAQVLIGTALVTGSLVAAPAAQAATIPVACSETALVNAVNLANSTPSADSLVLASGCNYVLTSAHGGLTDGLPVITTPMEMIGPAVITRGPLALQFRIIEVSTAGSLTLTTGVGITNGSAAGDGGGILNFGAVTLTNSSLSNNIAMGNGGGLANADTPSGTAPAATFTRSPVSGNTAAQRGGGIYNGLRGTLTASGVSGSTLIIDHNAALTQGGGIAAVGSTSTTLTQTAVTINSALVNSGGVYRSGGTMITNSSPITANTPNNCVGSVPAVPNCTG